MYTVAWIPKRDRYRRVTPVFQFVTPVVSCYGKIQRLQSKSRFHRIPKTAITLQRIQEQEYRYTLFLLSSDILPHAL